MNNEKEIEEMAEIIKADYKEWLDVTNCLPKGTSYYYECLGGAEDSAKKTFQRRLWQRQASSQGVCGED